MKSPITQSCRGAVRIPSSFSASRFIKSLAFSENPPPHCNGQPDDRLPPFNVDPLPIFHSYRKSGRYTVSTIRVLHALLLRTGTFLQDTFTASCLMDCYCKCAAMDDAVKLFDGIPDKSFVSWNMVISGYNQQAMFLESWEFFCRMHSSGFKPNDVTYGSIFSACTALRMPILGMLVYSLSMKIGFFSSGHVRTGIIDLFANSYRYEDALKVFHDVPTDDNVVSWNAVISTAVKSGEHQVALDHFKQMCSECLMPDSFTFSIIFSACTAQRDLLTGKAVQSWMIKCSSEDVFVGTALVGLYAKCCEMDEAMKVFTRMPSRNVVSWTAIISGFVQRGDAISAMHMFMKMRSSGEEINDYTICSILGACSKHSLTRAASIIHAWIIKAGFESYPSVRAALVSTYSKIRDSVSSEMAFTEMESMKNPSTPAALISASAQSNNVCRVMELYKRMLLEGQSLDPFTMSSLLSAIDSLDFGRQVHSHIIRSGLINDVSVSSSLFTMYSKCGVLDESYDIFKQMNVKDNVSWISMIIGFAEHHRWEEAVSLFKRMLAEDYKLDEMALHAILSAVGSLSWMRQGKEIHAVALRSGFCEDTVVGRSLVAMYVKCRSLISARQVFDLLPQKDGIALASLISGYAQDGQVDKAISLFNELLFSDISIGSYSISAVIGLATLLDRLDIGMQLHSYITKVCLDQHVSVGSALVNMYAKCGCIENCVRAFNQIETPDLIGWTAMIMGYARHGKGAEALRVFERMKETRIKPSPVTFTIVLSACSHSGLVEEGYFHFNSMVNDYGIKPNNRHCACMVDLLGRAGKLKEAERFINSMPIEPNALVWGALLTACRIHGDVELGSLAARKLVESEPSDSGTYVSLSNIFSGIGQWEEAANIWQSMKGAGVEKEPGWSVV